MTKSFVTGTKNKAKGSPSKTGNLPNTTRMAKDKKQSDKEVYDQSIRHLASSILNQEKEGQKSRN